MGDKGRRDREKKNRQKSAHKGKKGISGHEQDNRGGAEETKK